ncbi:MAG TPA: AMP-binding protein, partial [Acidimicrobiales bacterium]|nr:AMP-binding protein [Acidimicrobiales bacterium]
MTLVRSFLDRAALVTGRDARLGTLAARLGSVHGSALMVDEAPGVQGGGPRSDGRRLTFAQAAALVDRWAAGVAARIGVGDRVVLVVPNGYDLFLLCLAVSRAGGVPVPVNARMRGDEIEHVVEDSGASLVVRDVTVLEGDGLLGRAVDGAEGDVAAIFYTSGTTGR